MNLKSPTTSVRTTRKVVVASAIAICFVATIRNRVEAMKLPKAKRGEVIDALDLGGEVTAVVDGDLRWLLPVSETPSITREFREAEGIPVRVVPGTSLGTLIVRVDGERVGTVPVIARTPLSPTPGGPRSRSSAAEPPFADAVALVGRLVRGLVDAFL